MDTLVYLAALLIFLYGLISAVADRSPITAPMVFVAVGVLAGPLGFGLFEVAIDSKLVEVIAEVTLVLILFTDASSIKLKALEKEYTIPLRLLAIGLPLTMIAGFFLAIPFYPGVSWWLLAIMAFILSPTDAALGQAVVTSEKVPEKIRDTIGVESGLNDGIALPPIMACIAAFMATAGSELGSGYWIWFGVKQLVLGPIVGVGVGLVGGWLIEHAVRRRWMEPVFQRLSSIALALIAYALADQIGGNGFISAFCAGLFLAARSKTVRARIHEFGEAEGQQLSLFVFLMFGMVLVPVAHTHWDWTALAYALLSLTVIRMVPVALSLIGAKLDWQTVAFIGWFGPRGIASVLYLMILVGEIGGQTNRQILSVIVLTVLLSVFLHGLSAVPLSNLYGRYATRKAKVKPSPS